MARWRVDFIGKVLMTLGSIEAPDEKSAIVEAAKQFNITPARRNKIVVTRTQAADKRAPQGKWPRPNRRGSRGQSMVI